MPNVDRGADVVTCYEGKDGYALVDKAQWEWMKKEVVRLRRELSEIQGQVGLIDARRGSSQARSWIDFL